MVAAKRIAPLDPHEKPLGTVHIFTVDEPDKNRRRIIADATINQYVTKYQAEKIQLPTRTESRTDVTKHETQSQEDYAAYYDQFLLDPACQLYFCFEHDGTWWKLLRLPMGFTHSCAVACAATWIVAKQTELNLRDTTTSPPTRRTYIDNLRYSGTHQQVLEHTREFRRISESVGATLNKSNGPTTTEAFLGEMYCFKNKTKSSTPKTIRKLSAARVLATNDILPRRRWAAIFGIFFFAAPTTALPLAECYDLLLFFRRSVSSNQEPTERGWNENIGIPTRTKHLLQEALSTLIENVPTPCSPQDPEDDLHIVTDASVWGWGAISWRKSDNAFVHLHAEPWTHSH
jgi:hypothetical protein